MADFKPSVTKTLAAEGGGETTDVPGDSGGLTQYGISKKWNPDMDVGNLTQADAEAFYKRTIWDRMRGDEIQAQDVADSLYDSATNMGVVEAVKLAQRSLGIEETGHVDDDTLVALNT